MNNVKYRASMSSWFVFLVSYSASEEAPLPFIGNTLNFIVANDLARLATVFL